MTPKQKAPTHLRPETAAWWLSVIDEYSLEPHHVRLLTLAAESFDRCVEARELIAKEGMTYRDRFNQPRQHPACAVERDSKTSFVRILRELGLDVCEPEPQKPPTIKGRAK
ncbi:MAG: P27 family phage terminase small subunit [Pirellulales bacterium]|nr:P27 family phage terminase small subunit [Pirellulales bacterium]